MKNEPHSCGENLRDSSVPMDMTGHERFPVSTIYFTCLVHCPILAIFGSSPIEEASDDLLLPSLSDYFSLSTFLSLSLPLRERERGREIERAKVCICA